MSTPTFVDNMDQSIEMMAEVMEIFKRYGVNSGDPAEALMTLSHLTGVLGGSVFSADPKLLDIVYRQIKDSAEQAERMPVPQVS